MFSFSPSTSDSEVDYRPLLDNDEESQNLEAHVESRTLKCFRSASRLISGRYWMLSSLFQTAFILFGMIYDWRFYDSPTTSCHLKSLLYSPARDAVEYEVSVFHTGFHSDSSKYQGTSDEVDKAWEDLYNGVFQRVTKEEAALLPNKTAKVPEDEDHYIVALHVFHDLHCLQNTVRQALFDGYYHKYDMSHPKTSAHMSHCIDHIRNSLMCTPDLGVIVWQWDEEKQLTFSQDTTAHECVNYDKILEWADERRLVDGKFNRTKHLVEDLKIPIYWTDGTTH
ncbi:hypothetical protein DL96DRAFT_1752818 [Flagelloscypha sp. PMI_526]|nr:hypothetical protein DL96DRAFT_1752818 [Flagelloscypha sp. PMI_526]